MNDWAKFVFNKHVKWIFSTPYNETIQTEKIVSFTQEEKNTT